MGFRDRMNSVSNGRTCHETRLHLIHVRGNFVDVPRGRCRSSLPSIARGTRTTSCWKTGCGRSSCAICASTAVPVIPWAVRRLCSAWNERSVVGSVLENQAVHRNYPNDHHRFVSAESPESLPTAGRRAVGGVSDGDRVRQWARFLGISRPTPVSRWVVPSPSETPRAVAVGDASYSYLAAFLRCSDTRARRPWFSKVTPKLPWVKILASGGMAGPSFGAPGWP